MFHIRCPPHSLIPHHKWARILSMHAYSAFTREGKSFCSSDFFELFEIAAAAELKSYFAQEASSSPDATSPKSS